MKGFDPKYADPPDFVLHLARATWEDRDMTGLRDHHAPECVLHGCDGTIRGPNALVAATLERLVEFPDLTPLGEDVIWCAAPGDGIRASFRGLCTATHAGHGKHGMATGRRVTFRVLEELQARENRIERAWRIHDTGAIARQIGHGPETHARAMIAHGGGSDAAAGTNHSESAGCDGPAGNENAWGGRLAELVTRIMAADMAAIPAVYDRAAHLEYPGGVSGHGHAAADRFWMGLRASLPSARFDVHSRIGRDDPYMPPRAAIRWSLTGRHDGWGTFGRPTGASVQVMGMTHAEFGRLGTGPVQLRREWTLYDEIAIHKQILLHTGAV